MHTTYNKYPEVAVRGYDDHACRGWESIPTALNARASTAAKTVLVIDCYPGVRLEELEQHLLPALGAALTLNVESARRDEQAIHTLLARNLTDDRVFGVLSCHHLEEFFDPNKLEQLRQQVTAVTEGVVVIYGPARRWFIPATCWYTPTCRAGKSSSACATADSGTGGG